MAKKRAIRFGLLFAWLGLTIFLSEQSGAESANLSSELAKWLINTFSLTIPHTRLNAFLRELAHFGIHFILAILAYRALLTVFNEKLNTFISLISCSAIAAFDELSQQHIVGRAREVNDLILNLLGVSLGIIVGYLMSRPIKKPPQ